MLNNSVNLWSLQHVQRLLKGFTTKNLLCLQWQFRRKQGNDLNVLKGLQGVL